MLLILFGILIAVAFGVALKLLFDRLDNGYRISPFELVVGAVIISIVLAPGIGFVGMKMALSNNLSFHEYWGGFETAATASERTCTRDGSCRHTYDCDPYEVLVTKTRTVSDGNGGTKTETYTEWETRYHSCPYVTHETTYRINTTLGEYTIASAWAPENPDQHRWRASKSVPSRIPAGIPAQWAAARDRLAAGDPGPVTAVRDYDNYILASQRTIVRENSASIERYREAGLLPDNATGTFDHYLADKAYFPGLDVADVGAWQDAVRRFGGALGLDRQGDFHLVAVDADDVTDAEDYAIALKAHWQAPARGDDALSKNGLVLVVGVSGDRVDWARVFTGMPTGNEELIVAARGELEGVPFDPDALLGHPKARVNPESRFGAELATAGNGAFAKLVWDDMRGFVRQCMVCDDDGDVGVGFTYLSGEIQPTSGQKTAIIVMTAFAALLLWGVFLAVDLALPGRRSDDDTPTGFGGERDAFSRRYRGLGAEDLLRTDAPFVTRRNRSRSRF